MRQYSLLATALVLAAACSDDPAGPSTTMTAQMRADVAQSSGEAIAQHTEAMARSEASASATLFAFAGDPSAGGCTLTLGNLLCVSTFGSLDGEAELTFRDGTGAAQDDYDAETTATAEIEVDLTGEINRTGLAVDLASHGEFTVTGMAGNETSRTWNGTTSTTVTSAVHGGVRGYEWTANANWSSLVVATSGTEPRWPTSGTVTSTVQLEATSGPDAGKSVQTTVQVTFNGTATVPLKVGNAQFTLDLASRTVTAVN